jgi:hypothetical protein
MPLYCGFPSPLSQPFVKQQTFDPYAGRAIETGGPAA